MGCDLLVRRCVLGVRARGVVRHDAALLGEGATTDERVRRRLQPLARRAGIAQDPALRIGDADGRARRSEGIGDSGLEIHDRLALIGQRREVNGALEELSEVRLAPCASDPPRWSEAQEEGDGGGQGEQLAANRGHLALHQGADQHEDDRGDEGHGADCHRRHASPRDSARSGRRPGE